MFESPMTTMRFLGNSLHSLAFSRVLMCLYPFPGILGTSLSISFVPSPGFSSGSALVLLASLPSTSMSWVGFCVVRVVSSCGVGSLRLRSILWGCGVFFWPPSLVVFCLRGFACFCGGLFRIGAARSGKCSCDRSFLGITCAAGGGILGIAPSLVDPVSGWAGRGDRQRTGRRTCGVERVEDSAW